MTTLIDQAVDAIKKLPPDIQDDLARLMLNLAIHTPEPLTPETIAALSEADAQIAQGERVSPETMHAFWQSQGL
jgi:hypothetical protein